MAWGQERGWQVGHWGCIRGRGEKFRESRGLGKDQSGQPGSAVYAAGRSSTPSVGAPYPWRTWKICIFMVTIVQQVSGKHLENGHFF